MSNRYQRGNDAVTPQKLAGRAPEGPFFESTQRLLLSSLESARISGSLDAKTDEGLRGSGRRRGGKAGSM